MIIFGIISTFHIILDLLIILIWTVDDRWWSSELRIIVIVIPEFLPLFFDINYFTIYWIRKSNIGLSLQLCIHLNSFKHRLGFFFKVFVTFTYYSDVTLFEFVLFCHIIFHSICKIRFIIHMLLFGGFILNNFEERLIRAIFRFFRRSLILIGINNWISSISSFNKCC